MISNKEPKGTRDWFPEEFKIRQYIFNTWRKVCRRYAYEEYLTPLVENAAIYRAKSGEDVGGQELLTFKDLGGRELSIRPEMTPSISRMVSKIYSTETKPIRYFSVANFMRNEKPQRGRNREFWQLNCDIFGCSSLAADIELMQIALDIMLEFKAPLNSFKLALNSRALIDELMNLISSNKLEPEARMQLIRTLDKWAKLSKADLNSRLVDLGLLESDIKTIESFMNASSLDDLIEKIPKLSSTQAYLDIKQVIDRLGDLGYGESIVFRPDVIRGFDYYDGIVFEVFDMHPDNKRAMFGGGRYNGLAEIFGEKNFPAVGFAPGDETFRLFLESWDLLDIEAISKEEICYIPLLDQGLALETNKLASSLRSQGKRVLLGLEPQKLGKALDFANKKKIDELVILGSSEFESGTYKIKDMKSGEEKILKLQ